MKIENKFLGLLEKQNSKAVSKEIDDIVSGDNKYKIMLRKAKKNEDDIIEFLDYFYVKYENEIEKIAKKHKIDLDDLADIVLKG
jgi:hypothetical protein